MCQDANGTQASAVVLRIYLKTDLSRFPARGYKAPPTTDVSQEDHRWPRRAGSEGGRARAWESFGRFRTPYGRGFHRSWRNTGRRKPPAASTPNGGEASTASSFVCERAANGKSCRRRNSATTAARIVGFRVGTRTA